MASNRTLLVTGATLVGGAAIWFSTGNPFRSQGVKNIEDRWSAGGGTTTHTPAQATTRGRADLQDSPTEHKGVDSQHFADNIASQRPDKKGFLQQQFQEAQYGQSKGK